MLERDLKLIQVTDESSYLSGIVRTAAQQADQEKRYSEAVLLYNLAEEYNDVISVLNAELGSSLSRPPNPDNAGAAAAASTNGAGAGTLSLTVGEDDIAKVARSILDHYARSSGIARKVKRRNRETCEALLGLKEVMNLYGRGQLEAALSVRPLR
jgi:nuclear pore complex protein Nup93